MPRRRGKSVSFDAMVKFFMHQYDIPTRKDVEKLILRLDRLEKLLKDTAANGRTRRGAAKGGKAPAPGRNALTASDTVLEIIRASKDGIGFNDVQTQTGFGEKKLRNIIFRLHKIGKIKRQSRGIYTAI